MKSVATLLDLVDFRSDDEVVIISDPHSDEGVPHLLFDEVLRRGGEVSWSRVRAGTAMERSFPGPCVPRPRLRPPNAGHQLVPNPLRRGYAGSQRWGPGDEVCPV